MISSHASTRLSGVEETSSLCPASWRDTSPTTTPTADTDRMERRAAHQGRLSPRRHQDHPGAAGPLRVLGTAEALAED